MENNKPLISVIVPVYNVEKYLDRCVESIVGQTYDELEILLVDDGSTDSSGALCDAWQRKDGRIRVLHKANGGLTSAWKAGLELARGIYTGFVDSDDWIDADMYERLLTPMLRENADLSVAGLVFDFEDSRIPKREESSNFTEEVYDRAALEAQFPTLLNDGRFFGRTLQPARVTKLFRTELLRANARLCDERVAVGEDLQLTFPVLLEARKMVVVQKYYPYHYWINGASITGKYDPHYMDKICLLEERLLAISREKGVCDFAPQIRNDFLSLSVLAMKNEICRNCKSGRKTVVRHLREMLENPRVQEALRGHTMNQLSLSIRLYLWLMRHGCCNLCYVLVLAFFRLNYYLGREYKRQ